ncbi:MAG: 2-oxo acid dehydrogenase subunit E2 [Elusimicrobia bacterium]|nr:2-oxo acid dehydrogenase subunit E2 [Elusimicrobiota bacterium]
MANDPLLVTVPKENVNDESVRLAAWRAADRSAVRQGDVLAELETSKAIIEVTAPASGHVRHAAGEGASVLVGGPLCYITLGADDPLPLPVAHPDGPGEDALAGGGVRLSKGAKELILREGVDAAVFAGKGLVSARDVREHLHRVRGIGDASHLKGLTIRRVELPARKLAEVRGLSQGQNAGLASMVSLACPLAAAKKALGRLPELAATPSALIVSEAGRLLRKFPILNAYFDAGLACTYDEVHVGFVIDARRGLRVPVVRDVDKKDLKAVAREMQDLMLAYEEDSLTAENLSNGTFTVTDLSGEGVMSFQPLINQRQAAILGVAAPRPQTDAFDLILTFDHRLTEGRTAAMFLRDLRDRVTASSS